MNQCVIIVGETRDVMSHSVVDVLGVAVIFKVFVISVHSDGMGSANEKVVPMLKAVDKGE